MGVFLSHVDMTPIFYGLILALWAMVIIIHIVKFQILAVIIDISAFWIVFSMHRGSMTGGMAATVCGLLLSLIVPMILKFRR